MPRNIKFPEDILKTKYKYQIREMTQQIEVIAEQTQLKSFKPGNHVKSQVLQITLAISALL